MRPLSAKQREVLRHLLDGCRIENVAARMGLAVGTTKNHVFALYGRLGVNSRGQLMAKFMRPTKEAMRLMADGDA